jgi:hypothetical protein
MVDIKNRPRIPVPDEDPYTVAGNGGGSSGSSGFGASGSSGEIGRERVAATREQLLMQSQQLGNKRSEKPPKLPPRDSVYHHDMPKVCKNIFLCNLKLMYIYLLLLQPDYDDMNEENRIKLMARGKSDKGKDNKKYGK